MNQGQSTSVRDDFDVAPRPRARGAGKVRVFVSYDTERDGELYELLLGQSRLPGSAFTVLGRSERSAAGADATSETTRRRIEAADQIIVICGEHTDDSLGVFAELRTAQEEKKPYFLLWGRRTIMCTKPMGAKPAEGMYSWTQPILEDQLAFARRKAHADTTAEALRNPSRKGRPAPAEVVLETEG